jgi:hypothetical protein
MLDHLPESARLNYQPALVLRAHCLRDLGLPGVAEAALSAVAATGDPRFQAHLRRVFGVPPGQ